MAGYTYSPRELLAQPTKMTDMQDRIKQLAVEVGLIYPDSKDGRMITEYGDYAEEITKLVQAVAMELIAISKEHDKEGFATHMMQEHARARFGLATPPGDG